MCFVYVYGAQFVQKFSIKIDVLNMQIYNIYPYVYIYIRIFNIYLDILLPQTII